MRLACCLSVVLLFSPFAQAAESADEVVQTVNHGEINWTTSSITVTGSGAPNLKAPNVAVARLGA